MSQDSIWEPDPPGRIWTMRGSGLLATSTRNDALWAETEALRRRNLVQAAAWRDAAVADGWSIQPTYDHESVDRAWRLGREGFKALGLTRPGNERELPCASVHVWGPDGLAVRPPPVYDWPAIVAGARTCSACGTVDVETQRFSFAGRCCAACRPEMARRYEQPGWSE